MQTPLAIDFFHDVVCCWCFNISSRLRQLASEMPLDIRHRTFVLQASRTEMADRWGSPAEAKRTILGHWANCRELSDWPELIVIEAMRATPFDYPHGWTAALACKAAERLGGQATHWDMFDRIQRAHLTEARDIANPDVLAEAAGDVGLEIDAFRRLAADPSVAQAVTADRCHARALQVRSIPALIVRDTGARLVNGPLDDLRAQLHAAARLVAHS